jgi:hypothetical protein
MEPLLTVEGLTEFGVDVGTDTALAARLLDAVSAAVRDAAGTPITEIATTVTIPTECSHRIELPSRPVTGVTSVTLDGQPVTGWRLVGSSLWLDRLWRTPNTPPGLLTCEYTSGYSETPPDIEKLVATFVAAGLYEYRDGIGSRRGLSSVGIDDFRETYTRGEDEIIDMTQLPASTRRMLRERFSSDGFTVVGSIL